MIFIFEPGLRQFKIFQVVVIFFFFLALVIYSLSYIVLITDFGLYCFYFLKFIIAQYIVNFCSVDTCIYYI